MNWCYPSWLPYPVSWFRAIANMFCWSLICQWYTWPFLGQEYKTGDLGSSDLAFAVFLTLFCLFLWMSIGHHQIAKLRGKASGFFPRWLSWREGLNAVIVAVLELFGISIFMVFIALSWPRWADNRLLIGLLGSIVLSTMAYLYHYDFLVRERRAANRAKRKAGKGGEQSSPPHRVQR